jgi:ABC-type antimicrobial peptide transport system permease subunit
MGGVGITAALLTALGIYVLAESLAARRRRELAIRAALGASGSRLGVLVLREALMLTGLGVLIGVAVVWAASDAVRMFLFQIEPFDPPSLSAVSLLLFLLFLAVSLKPARAATSMDVARLLAEE